ncbi:MaoC/PaaZ C-terminal domain-containing protein [Variovorax sp. J22G21]|uniref:MaoC family dehydratase n=1 Tax=Variovorax fucosicus TaxID=3053517 RepID=UPI002578CAE7|nr:MULTISPECIES: MaoC/PaaZ C-terminal domain-containing protein [unclassified Variovorax]MDM0037799.1 MaoC/PaaZ C-terminal domain-containing protein [Variovorax sp. J22R193]MDM0056532.1 MaoC/PaaZ C-terminal domain-containing protein [Variovorax sp. J22G47]MDM0062575.1 MaoC/PaaZ C-terminal domain-containing protein [Variovorax sp. J22G21]
MLEVCRTDRPDVGTGYRFSRAHTFDEEQVRSFSLAAGDENPLHVDADYATGTRFGGLIASATHTTSLLMGLTATHFSSRGSVLGMNFSFELLHAVKATESVLLEWVVTSVATRAKGGLVLGLGGTVTSLDGRTLVLAQGQVSFVPKAN